MAKASEAKKDVAQSQGDQVPDYIKQGTSRGSENVTTDDVTIPRIEIAQALSPCLNENEADHIPGIKQGDMFNTITRQNYGPVIVFVPVFFKKEYLVWRNRKEFGEGFRGAYPTVQLANDARKEVEKPEEWEIIDTGQHLVLVVHADGKAEEAMLSMAKTKAKVSRQLNSLVRINGGDRFSRAYTLFTVDDENSQGKDYKNFGVANHGFPTEAVYRQAEALYSAVSTGERDMVMDPRGTGGAGEAAAGSTEY